LSIPVCLDNFAPKVRE
jgi:hypothetical protein